MIKYFILFSFYLHSLLALDMYAPVVAVDKDYKHATIKVANKVQVGMSGFAIHKITDQHASVLNNIVVTSYNEANNTARVALKPFELFHNSALPSGKWKLQKGDIVELAFNYSRGLLIAPSADIYYAITRKVKLQWVHPDLFAALLSYKGHPTPLQSDFRDAAKSLDIGLIFLYLDQKVYTLDSKSFVILSVSDAPLTQTKTQQPFYSRIKKIEANWFGKGSDEMQAYAPHYYELLVHNNPKNKQLYEAVQTHNYQKLLKEFTIGKDL